MLSYHALLQEKCLQKRKQQQNGALNLAEIQHQNGHGVSSILTVIWHMFKHNTPYRDLGAEFYDGFHREHRIKAYLKRLQALGWVPEPHTVSA